jgi:aryl-alcohol dehydrogenase-like predicted oxidoreductase
MPTLGETGLECHPIGFGCYRVSDDNTTHADALGLYLERGGNLIDTSANYMDGESEILVGRMLRFHDRGKVILVTKGGYIQGRNMTLAQERQFPEVVQYGPGIWHSIHPEFLETQVRLSSERLQADYLDVYLLHNPEYYLEVPPAGHDEFYRRIREAFRFLESQVAAGKIRWYGVSSNNYPTPVSDPHHTSVARTLAAAEEVSANHHFRVVQLPMNLYESGGALEPNNNGKTVLEYCREKGLGVLANRPLNAYHHNHLVRLADFHAPGSKPPGPDELRAVLRPLAEHEQKLHRDLGAELMGPGIAASLLDIVPRILSVSQWEQAAGPYVIRPIQSWIQQCRQTYGGRPEWGQWLEEFLPLINGALEGVQRHLQAGQQAVSDEVRVAVAQAGYPPSGESLSRLALNVLLGLDGLSCVLVGMRRAAYVEDALGAVGLDRVPSLQILLSLQGR